MLLKGAGGGGGGLQPPQRKGGGGVATPSTPPLDLPLQGIFTFVLASAILCCFNSFRSNYG